MRGPSCPSRASRSLADKHGAGQRVAGGRHFGDGHSRQARMQGWASQAEKALGSSRGSAGERAADRRDPEFES